MVGLEKVFVTYTCKNKACEKAFIDEDFFNNINEVPLKTRYCPECVKKGFKNTKPQKIRTDVYISVFNEMLLESNVSEKKDVDFLKKYYNKQIDYKKENKYKIYPKKIFAEALEVLGYQDWKRLDK